MDSSKPRAYQKRARVNIPTRRRMTFSMGRERILVKTSVQTRWASHGVGCLGALALIPIVSAVVTLFMGDNGPRGIEDVVPWLWVSGAVFAAATGFVWFRSKKPLMLTEGKNALVLRIAGERYAGPFTCEYAYMTEHMKGIPMRHLILHVYDAERHVCSLGETWGAMHGTPSGWREDFLPPRSEAGPAWVAAAGRFVDDVRLEIEERPPA